MRTFHQYFHEVSSNKSVENYINNVKFRIIYWNSSDKIFEIIVNGEIRKFEFYTYGNHSEEVAMIEAYYRKSKSVGKTIDYIQKRFAKLLPGHEKEKKNNLTGKFVKCPECEQSMQISGNKPGTVCPNCGKGILEVL